MGTQCCYGTEIYWTCSLITLNIFLTCISCCHSFLSCSFFVVHFIHLFLKLSLGILLNGYALSSFHQTSYWASASSCSVTQHHLSSYCKLFVDSACIIYCTSVTDKTKCWSRREFYSTVRMPVSDQIQSPLSCGFRRSFCTTLRLSRLGVVNLGSKFKSICGVGETHT